MREPGSVSLPQKWKTSLRHYSGFIAIHFKCESESDAFIDATFNRNHVFFGLPFLILDGDLIVVPKDAAQEIRDSSFEVEFRSVATGKFVVGKSLRA